MCRDPTNLKLLDDRRVSDMAVGAATICVYVLHLSRSYILRTTYRSLLHLLPRVVFPFTVPEANNQGASDTLGVHLARHHGQGFLVSNFVTDLRVFDLSPFQSSLAVFCASSKRCLLISCSVSHWEKRAEGYIDIVCPDSFYRMLAY